MNEKDRAGEESSFSRRELTEPGAFGAGLVLLLGSMPVAARQEPPDGTVVYRDREISVYRRNGRRELRIDGRRIVTVDSNGACRAANFMFSPARTRVELAQYIIDYEIALSIS